jgi:ATP-dependent Clp protease ATP-binding subunit ClpA
MSSKFIGKFSKERYREFYGARPFKRLIGNEIENSNRRFQTCLSNKRDP